MQPDTRLFPHKRALVYFDDACHQKDGASVAVRSPV